MTLCIAARCQTKGEPHIVLCCDWLSSDEYGSSETCDKLGELKPGWPFLIAATVHKADEFTAFLGDEMESADVTSKNALSTVRSASLRYMAMLRDENSKLRYGSTVPELVDKKVFTREEIESISTMLTTGAEIILTTIIDGTPFIFEIRPDGSVVSQRDYALIGTIAQASAFMQWRNVNSDDELGVTLYEVYEAKRFAEMDANVGPMTSIYVLKPNGKLHRVKEAHLRQMDRQRRKADSLRQSIDFKSDWLCRDPESFID